MVTIVPRHVLLASGSVYRRELLARILSSFEQVSPNVDETPGRAESPERLAMRLARAKALAVPAPRGALVLGADQVAEFAGTALGKPATTAEAIARLLAFRGHAVRFFTAVCIVPAHGGPVRAHTDETVVRFRHFSATLGERYVASDAPYDCAGGFRIESGAPVLLDEVRSTDPTALIGLPLIWVAKTLEEYGVELL